MSEGQRPLIVGEVLFDVMPDGTRVLGGAPFDVAGHLEFFVAVCTVQGATVRDRGFRSEFRKSDWS